MAQRRQLTNRESVRAAITPVLGLPVDNTELRWPRGYVVYGWDASGFGRLHACCPAMESAAKPLTRQVRDDVRGREVTLFAGAPVGTRSKWMAKAHLRVDQDQLGIIGMVLDETGEHFRSPVEHGFVLGYDSPVSSVFACCDLVDRHLDTICRTVRYLTRDQHFSHR